MGRLSQAVRSEPSLLPHHAIGISVSVPKMKEAPWATNKSYPRKETAADAATNSQASLAEAKPNPAGGRGHPESIADVSRQKGPPT